MIWGLEGSPSLGSFFFPVGLCGRGLVVDAERRVLPQIERWLWGCRLCRVFSGFPSTLNPKPQTLNPKALQP